MTLLEPFSYQKHKKNPGEKGAVCFVDDPQVVTWSLGVRSEEAHQELHVRTCKESRSPQAMIHIHGFQTSFSGKYLKSVNP